MRDFLLPQTTGPIYSSDLQPIVEFLQSLNFQGDGSIVVDHNAGGVYIKSTEDPVSVSEGGGVTSGNTFGTEIQSGANGVYQGKKIDQNTGEVSDTEITILATRQTAYNLNASRYAVGFSAPVLKMG